MRAGSRGLGLCRDDGPGSLSRPDLTRTLYGDGKVVAPLFKAKRRSRVVNPLSGKVRFRRADPDARLHVTGEGETVYGNKMVLLACRTSDVHGRMILDLDWVPSPGGEARHFLDCVERVRPFLAGAQALLYDGLLRGVHLQELLHERGLLPIVPVQAASGGRRARKPRTEKVVRIEQRQLGDGRKIDLYARAGALGIVEYDEDGESVFIPLCRRKVMSRTNADGTYRWYGTYRLPTELGGGEITVRLDTTDEDRRRKFNRTENLRPIPPSDEDYNRLYPRRSDIESINRVLEDSLWLNRAHSVGGVRQRVEALGFALTVNSVAVFRAWRRREAEAQPPRAV